MGRFTLRDDGKTICVGKIIKYKPYSKGAVNTAASVAAVTKKLDETQINSSSAPVKELVYNMDTGETSEKAAALNSIAEEAD